MRIDRLKIKNFRNLADVDLKLSPRTVVVGENRAGKSNLVHALRLVLDPSLSQFDRQLTREDFWDGLSDGTADWDPLAAGEVIEISVEIVDFASDPILLTALSDALLEEDPPRASLTYRFAPNQSRSRLASTRRSYRPVVFGGGDEDRIIPNDLRGYLFMIYMDALRNVEADIRSWKKSPLRSLLEAAAEEMGENDLAAVRVAMVEANRSINDHAAIKDLGSRIGNRTREMVGDHHALETELAVGPEEPLRLIRGLEVYVDGSAHRNLSSSSLGAKNVLYMALLELGLRQKLAGKSIAHVLMAIEEPEAHLHPHLQRLMFREFLGREDNARTVLVTTHSPHIASVADPQGLVALHTVENQVQVTEARNANLSPADWDDIRRYLDVTRAEMVFARRVLLVEGFAEEALMPTFARSLGMDLDKEGITVCSIDGTHFTPFAKFCRALGIPWAVVTDGDPGTQPWAQGLNRAAALLSALELAGTAADNGIFVGQQTLEHDLVSVPENLGPCLSTLNELVAAPTATKIQGWDGAVPEYNEYMNVIDNAGGKGRFAQRLASCDLVPPPYIASALQYLVHQ